MPQEHEDDMMTMCHAAADGADTGVDVFIAKDDAFNFRVGETRYPTAEELGLPPDPPDFKPGPPMRVVSVDVENGTITLDDA